MTIKLTDISSSIAFVCLLTIAHLNTPSSNDLTSEKTKIQYMMKILIDEVSISILIHMYNFGHPGRSKYPSE